MLWNWLGLDDSDQRELERKLAASRATQASNLADLTEYIKSTADQNKNLWSDYQIYNGWICRDGDICFVYSTTCGKQHGGSVCQMFQQRR